MTGREVGRSNIKKDADRKLRGGRVIARKTKGEREIMFFFINYWFAQVE